MKKLFTLVLLSGTYLLQAQNVGVATAYPNNGKIVIKNTGSLSGLVVGDSTSGISFNEPGFATIGFNNYYRIGRKQMADGFASYFYFNSVNGTLYYNNTAVTGTQGTAPSLTNRFSINKDGEVGVGILEALAGLHVRGKSVLIDNTSGFGDVTLTATTSTIGGLIELRNNTNIRTVAMRAGDGSGVSGELIFYDNTGSVSSLELDGDYSATGRSRIIVDELQIKGGADFAEYFDVAASGETTPLAGMLVCIDPNNSGKLVVSHTPYDKKIAGVISGANGVKPGMMMGHKGTVADGEQPVAITGRVYVMAEALHNAIEPGDLLTTSAIAGHAMKAASYKKAQGAVVGKAMSKLPAGTKGMVLVLLGIQ
ncbi:MAG: hypothetical protein V4722_07450 [Bacteroidota bacterium]